MFSYVIHEALVDFLELFSIRRARIFFVYMKSLTTDALLIKTADTLIFLQLLRASSFVHLPSVYFWCFLNFFVGLYFFLNFSDCVELSIFD